MKAEQLTTMATLCECMYCAASFGTSRRLIKIEVDVTDHFRWVGRHLRRIQLRIGVSLGKKEHIPMSRRRELIMDQ